MPRFDCPVEHSLLGSKVYAISLIKITKRIRVKKKPEIDHDINFTDEFYWIRKTPIFVAVV